MFVGWKASGQRTVSRAETVGMGGLFLHTPDPLPTGSLLELLFDLKTGEVRARAIVRHSSPGKGMGIQFVQMQPPDRARLNQFLLKYAEAEVQGEPDAARPPRQTTAAAARAAHAARSNTPPKPQAVDFERDMSERLEQARKGTYYQLLAIAPESSTKQIKQAFYAMARKFHPDYHMDQAEWKGPLKELMGAVTTAYKVLSDTDKRATYDAQLSDSGAYYLRRTKSASQTTLDDSFARASELLKASNFVASVPWLRKCVEIAPENAQYRALLARSLGMVPQYRNDAIAQFERAVELDPLNTTVFMQFAELYEAMQLPSRARPLYTKVLGMNPLHAKARERLAQLETPESSGKK
jgi:tetratricopeptide (TPR) repeat protein